MACALVSWLSAASAAGPVTAPDHPLVGRFEEASMIKHETKPFDSYRLLIRRVAKASDAGQSAQLVEGKLVRAVYETPAARTTVEVMRAYEAALRSTGFKTIYHCAAQDCGGLHFNRSVSAYRSENTKFGGNHEDQRYIAAHLARPQGDVYTAVYTVRNTSSGGPDKNKVYTLVEVIEIKPMEAKVEVIGADRMAADIGAQGRVALYGIHFDTGSAEVRPESAPTLEEITKLLKGNPALRLHVVGHTDNQGTASYNLNLSKQRAEAVVRSLTGSYGVAADRLAGHGVAFLAPVATNRNEEGRSRNRRVELIEQ